MRGKLIVLLCAALLLVFAPMAMAQEEGKAGLGIDLGYVLPQGDSIADDDIVIDADFNSTWTLGLSGTYWFADQFSLELAVEYLKTGLDFKVPGVATLDVGELQQIPILLTARFHPVDLDNFSPYIGVGAGYYINDFDTSKTLEVDAEDELEADSNAGFHIAAGGEYFVDDNIALNLDLRYQFNQIKLKVKSDPNDSENLDVNAFVAQVGLKYYF